MKNIFVFIILAILGFSCEITKEIDYNTIYGGDVLIVHGLISPQDGVRVVVKKTLAPNKIKDDDRVTNAVVTVFEGDKQIAVLNQIDDYLFVSDEYFVPEQGKKYSIRASADGFAEIRSAEQLIAAATPIDSMRTVSDDRSSNFLHLLTYFTHSNTFSDSYYLNVTFYHQDGEPWYKPDEFFNPFLANDNTPSGVNAFENQIYLKNYSYIDVELFILSPDLAHFLESFRKYDSSRDDPFFERPHPVFSNITGGQGIFGSYSVCRERI